MIRIRKGIRCGCAVGAENGQKYDVMNIFANIVPQFFRNARRDPVRKRRLEAAAGTVLGRLVSVDYSWGEINIYSRTEYAMDAKCMAMPCGAGMDFHPEDIDLQDSATFVWEMQ